MTRARRVASLIVGIALCGTVLAACGRGGSGTTPPPSYPPHDAALVAEGLAFSRAVLDLPAERAFVLLFENRDGPPHNVALVDESGKPVFEGEVFSGPAWRLHEVPPLTPGAYRIACDVHPEMTGVATAS